MPARHVMNNLEADKGTVQLVASEASAGAKGGWGDCDDLAIRRDNVDANAHHAGTRIRKEGTGDLSSSNPEATLKLKKSREKQACYRQNMLAEKRDKEQQILDSIRMNETPEKMKVRLEKERKQSATHWNSQSDKARAENGKYIFGYMSKKRAKAKATLPPSLDEEEEVDATVDPPPSSPEQQYAETTAVDALMALTKTKQSSEQFKGMNFTKMVSELISKDKDWKENTRPLVNCEENCSMQIECNNYCQGREGCSNKCIQKGEVKNVRKGQRGEKGFGLFLQLRISKGVST